MKQNLTLLRFPLKSIIEKLKEFIVPNKGSEAHVFLLDKETYKKEPDALVKLLRNTLNKKEYRKNLTLKTEPIEITDAMRVLFYKDKLTLSNFEKGFREFMLFNVNYHRLIGMYLKEVSKVLERHKRDFDRVMDFFKKGDYQEAEIEAESVVESVLYQLSKVKDPSAIANRIGIIDTFNNGKLIPNEQGEYPTYRLETVNNKSTTVNPLTDDEIATAAYRILDILEEKYFFEHDVIETLSQLPKMHPSVDRLLDTGLTAQAHEIADLLSVETIVNKITFPNKTPDVFDLIEGLIDWIEHSIEASNND